MSEIFCTFAPDFNSGVHDLLNTHFLMDGQCIFRAQFKGRKFSIIEQDLPKLEGSKIYWVYEDRRRIDKFYWRTLGGAIGSLLMEYSLDIVHELRKVWP